MKLLGAFNPSYPFPKPWFTRMLWFKLKRWFEQNQYFCVQTFFYTRAVLHKNCIIHKHNVLHKNHVLAGPVQGLFAAYKIALSMVAGGTRQRLLNIAWMGVIHYIPMKSLLDCRFTPFWTPSFPCGILGGASHWINELYPQVYVYIYIQIHTYIYISPLIYGMKYGLYVELKTTDPIRGMHIQVITVPSRHPGSTHLRCLLQRSRSSPRGCARRSSLWLGRPDYQRTNGGFWAHFCRPNRCLKVGKLGIMR